MTLCSKNVVFYFFIFLQNHTHYDIIKQNTKGSVFLKKSAVKTFLKSALLTLGVLLFLYSLLNPLTYYLGVSTTASADNIDIVQIGDNLYQYNIDYHYFVSGIQYSDDHSFESSFDEKIEYDLHNVKYIPLFPSLSVMDLHYTTPLLNYIFFFSGLFLLILSLFIKTEIKEKASSFKKLPEEKVYLCPVCKNPVDSDSIFCSHCGRKLIL